MAINYLSVENISKAYGDRTLFSDITFGIEKNEKVGLIAKNGIGKSTLLHILTGLETSDTGRVVFNKQIKIGFLAQNPKINENNTVLNEILSDNSTSAEVILQYKKAIKNNNQSEISILTEKIDDLELWEFESQVEKYVTQLNIPDIYQKINTLSGGQKKRISIAKLLLQNPDFVILDEPTNHLDVEIIEWLQDYLEKTNKTLLMVTHDRYFLDVVCDKILEIDEEELYKYNGNYTYFLEKRAERKSAQQKEIDKAKNLLKTELEWLHRQPKARTHKNKSKIKQVLTNKDIVSSIKNEKHTQILVESTRLGKKILELKNLNKQYDNLCLINDFSYIFKRNDKIGIVGKNGIGKTTFLNIITQQLAPDSGIIEMGETLNIGYYKQTDMHLPQDKRIIEFLSEIAEYVKINQNTELSLKQFLEQFLFPSEMHYLAISKLSGGEKKRLYLMSVLIKQPNFLILDEPTNDLDIFTLNVLEDYINNFNGCVIIVSHDRYFLNKTVNEIFYFSGKGFIKPLPGNYDYYLNYKKQQNDLKAKEEKPKENKVEAVKKTSVKGLSYKFKIEFEQLEKELPQLENKKETIEKELASGKLDYEKISNLSKKLESISNQIDEKTERWFELSEIAEKK